MRHWFLLGIKVQGKGLRKLGISLREVQKEALRDTAEFWHAKVFPGHFETTARNEYAGTIRPRNRGYIFETKIPEGEGLGRTVANRLKNQSLRRMTYLYRVTATSRVATVTMNAPAYFTHPYVGPIFQPSKGRTVVIRSQPDKPKEVTAVSRPDREELRQAYQERLTAILSQKLGRPATVSRS